MTGFWDDPQHQPSGGSWPAEGKITRLAVMMSPRYQRLTLVVELDGDGRQRWCSMRLWRALAESRADVGDRVRVTRGPDEPNPQGTPIASWIVERLSMPAPAPAWTAVASNGPTW